MNNLIEAADRFRLLFVGDSEPPCLTVEVDHNEMADAYDTLEKEIAAARAKAAEEPMATRFKGDVSLILWMAAIFGVAVALWEGVKWVAG